MRNLIPVSTRRWRLPLAPDMGGGGDDSGGDERVVASCYDAESRVLYAVTNACNLYGLHTPAAGATPAPSSSASTAVCLEMSLLGGGGDGGGDEDGPALPARADIVGMEYVIELAGVCIAASSGELLLVAPDPDAALGGNGMAPYNIIPTFRIPQLVHLSILLGMSWG